MGVPRSIQSSRMTMTTRIETIMVMAGDPPSLLGKPQSDIGQPQDPRTLDPSVC